MQLGDHLGFAGIAFAFLLGGLTVFFSTKKWLGYGSLVACVLVCFAWRAVAVKEAKHESVSAVAEVATPRVDVQLAIDRISPSKARIRLILQNGPVTIHQISYLYATGEVSFIDPGNIVVDRLGPGEHRELFAQELDTKTGKIDVRLLVTYLGQREEQHYAKFSFAAAAPLQSAQPYAPVASLQGDGDGKADELGSQFMDQFSGKLGTFYFVFPERQPDGSPTRAAFRSANRQLLVDSAQRKVVLQAMYPSGTKFEEKTIPALESGSPDVHVLAATWNDAEQKIGLAVDPDLPASRPR